MVNRTTVVQSLIDVRGLRNYLEIGVAQGDTFLKVRARHKTGVDPAFGRPGLRNIPLLLTNPSNLISRFYAMTSDEYFARHTTQLMRHPPGVVLVDGLHAYQQVVRDALCALKYLMNDGVIVLHDCNPPTEVSSYPADAFEKALQAELKGWTGDWCGDVWKAIVWLRARRPDLRVFVLNCDYGLGIVTRGTPENTLSYSDEEIAALSYRDLEGRRESLLNLKSPDYFLEFLGQGPAA